MAFTRYVAGASTGSSVALGGVENDKQIPRDLASALVSAAFGRWDELESDEATPRVERFPHAIRPATHHRRSTRRDGHPRPALGKSLDRRRDPPPQFRIALFTAAAVALTEAPRNTVDRLAEYLKSLGPGR